jgi:hypothetical protein
MAQLKLTTIKRALIFAGMAVAVIAAFKTGDRLLTKRFSPEAQAIYNSGKLSLVVDYCQPAKKGRDIFNFSGLVPYGEVWRTGANEATQVTIQADALVKGQLLAAGTYTLFTIPEETGWTIIFNDELDQWGAFDYNPDMDVLRVNVPRQATSEVAELFTINFVETDSAVNMELRWDNTLVTVPFTPAM